MTQTVQRERALSSARRVDKFAERREQLAEAALQTLGELGYARTSLREIAQNSDFSHGVLHYYFTDKVDLIMHCVKQYKATCITRYDHIVESSHTADELRQRFADGLAATMIDDAPMHRLWYDLRSQSLFEESFRVDVGDIDLSLQRMIWNVVRRYAELSGRPASVSPEVAYGMLDGLFQQALFKHLSGDLDAGPALTTAIQTVLPRLI